MNRIAGSMSIALAFVAGCVVSYVMRPARAAVENLTAQVIHAYELNGDAISTPSVSGLRFKTVALAEGASVAIQDGNTPKHLHHLSNELQFVLEGTGTMWLGDKEVRLRPGDLVVIPKGVPHGGTKTDGRPFKPSAIKTPPQAPGDMQALD